MKKLISIFLVLIVSISLCACGLSEGQQAFVDAVALLETDSDIPSIRNGLELYYQLETKELENEDVEGALMKLVDALNQEIELVGSAELELEFDKTLDEIDALCDDFPDSVQEHIVFDGLNEAKSRYLDYFVDEYGKYVDNLLLLNDYSDNMEFEKMDALIDELLPLTDIFAENSYYQSIEEVNEELGYESVADAKELLEDWKELIDEICYTDTYCVRYEIICDYSRYYVESGTTFFSYGYTYSSDMWREYKLYKDYLDENFELIDVEENGDGSLDYIYNIGKDQSLELSYLVIDEWEVYAVWIEPPFLAEDEQDW